MQNEYFSEIKNCCINLVADCTFVIPEKRNASRLPTIVFLHGDSYEWSSGNPYDGTVLSGFGNVIVVTLNYRLGILGFMPGMEPGSKANYGLMDQIAALNWVQDNIAQFGGDPRNVTLVGHGYGASCAHLLMYSPKAQGLFQRVILQSGSAFSPWALAHESMTFTRHVARKLACPVLDHPALVRCMRQRPLSEIMRVQLMVPAYLTAFGPMVDGFVIPADPEQMLLNPHPEVAAAPKMDVLMGVTKIESYFFFGASEERYGIEGPRRDRILRTLVRNLFTFHLQEIFLTIVNEYTDWSKPVQHPMNILDGTIEALTDALVVAPTVSSANLLSKMSHRTYLYVFSSPIEDNGFPPRLTWGHGEDIPYLFGAPLSDDYSQFTNNNYTKPEIALSEGIMQYWANFAKLGDPNISHDVNSPEKIKGRFERLLWPLYDGIEQKYLSLTMKPKIRDHYHAHRLSFWLSLIPKLHRQGVTPDVASQHHLLDDHDNPLTYDGVVRQGSVLAPIGMPPRLPTMKPRFNNPPTTANPGAKTEMSSTTDSANEFNSDEELPSLELSPVSSENNTNVSGSLASSGTDDGAASMTLIMQVTIIVGASMLTLNISIFTAVYVQRISKKCGGANTEAETGAPPEVAPEPVEEEPEEDSEPFVEIERPPIAPVKAPPPSPDLHRISDVSQGSDNSQASSHIIPPPPTFLPTDSPPMSPDNIPTYIPMEDLGNKTKVSLTREEINAIGSNYHTATKVHWAPDVGCEEERDAVWL